MSGTFGRNYATFICLKCVPRFNFYTSGSLVLVCKSYKASMTCAMGETIPSPNIPADFVVGES